LGARLAIELASLGANLSLHARKIEHLETTKTACQKFGHGVDVFAANLEYPEKVQAMIQGYAQPDWTSSITTPPPPPCTPITT